MARREPPGSEITPEALYQRRREFIRNGALYVGASALFGGAVTALSGAGSARRVVAEPPAGAGKLTIAERGRYVVPEATTPYDDVTSYNNFYEFGTGKGDPSQNAHSLKTRPWMLRVTGEVNEARTIDIDTLLGWFGLEERVYRMRCVEAWSMVIPWVGFPLAALIRRLEPTSKAKYVQFETLFDEAEMPETRSRVLDWPYVEGLRMDEATHPLALIAVGLYGRVLPNQNGAPLRLVLPWKYGFKGIKSIVRMRFVEKEPETTWSRAASSEYGFYANVNPAVDHPRWSQATERRIGELSRRPTLPFNGYANEVASLYRGMDLKRYF